MLQTIEAVNSAVNQFIWGVPAMICILGVGLYLSLRLHFIQIRRFSYAMKTTIGRVFRKREVLTGLLRRSRQYVRPWRLRWEREILPV